MTSFYSRKNASNIPDIVSALKKSHRIKDINEVQVLTPFRRRTENGVEQLNKALQNEINPKIQS